MPLNRVYIFLELRIYCQFHFPTDILEVKQVSSGAKLLPANSEQAEWAVHSCKVLRLLELKYPQQQINTRILNPTNTESSSTSDLGKLPL